MYAFEFRYRHPGYYDTSHLYLGLEELKNDYIFKMVTLAQVKDQENKHRREQKICTTRQNNYQSYGSLCQWFFNIR